MRKQIKATLAALGLAGALGLSAIVPAQALDGDGLMPATPIAPIVDNSQCGQSKWHIPSTYGVNYEVEKHREGFYDIVRASALPGYRIAEGAQTVFVVDMWNPCDYWPAASQARPVPLPVVDPGYAPAVNPTRKTGRMELLNAMQKQRNAEPLPRRFRGCKIK